MTAVDGSGELENDTNDDIDELSYCTPKDLSSFGKTDSSHRDKLVCRLKMTLKSRFARMIA